MHPTAMQNSNEFFACYKQYLGVGSNGSVIDIGAQDVNGSLRDTCPSAFAYIGVDFVAGRGVDVVLSDPYILPFPSESADVILSSSCFEHSEMFWLLFLEVLRVLKPHGLFYLNAPSNGDFHRWPVDCWRFYPDCGRALISWAARNGFHAALLESYTSLQIGDQWNDFVAVFLKDESKIQMYPERIVDSKVGFNNGLRYGSNEFLKPSPMPEDKRKLTAIGQIATNQLKIG